MSFFKTNAHWLVLSTAAALSVAGTAFLLKDFKEFPEAMDKLQPRQVIAKKPAPVDLSRLESATKLIAEPGKWGTEHSTQLFVSEPYLMEADGLKRPKEGSLHKHSRTGQPIPNSWFLQHKLPLGSAQVSTADTDGDGFTNEEEWAANTDPNDPKSHPAIITKLSFVKEHISHNRISFLQYLGDPKKTSSLKITLRREDAPQRPQSDLKIGDTIPDAGITLTAFTPRRKDDSGIKDALDGALVTLKDIKSGETSDAEVKGRPADFMDKTVTLRLSHRQENREIVLKIGQTFNLGASETFTLIDSSSTKATVKDAAGKTFEITPSQAD